MPLNEFHCVVLGDQPAGLWLLHRLHGAFGNGPIRPAFGWVSFTGKVPRVAVPVPLAEGFGLPTSPRWHFELVTPQRNLMWKREALEVAFPELQPFFDAPPTLTPTSGQLATVGRALRAHPELLALAHGVWKYVGRTHFAQPENLVWGALRCAEMVWWRPDENLPETVTRLDADSWDHPIEEIIKLKPGGLSLQFRGMNPVVSKRWVTNLGEQPLRRICSEHKELSDWVGLDGELQGGDCLYSLRVETDDGCIPAGVPPVSILFDTECMPEWDTEMWPLEIERDERGTHLRLLVSAPRHTSLDTLLGRFRQGMQRLNRVFPFLAFAKLRYRHPLNMETCFDDTQRFWAVRGLESDCVELYDRTSLLTQSRHGAITLLGPHLQCNLPYPMGPLSAAQRLMTEWTGRNGFKELRPPPEARA